MKKVLLTIAFALVLAGCNSTNPYLTKEKLIVAVPDEAMYNCPVVKKFPEWKTLTEEQVAKLLVQLNKNNLTCKSSLESIRKFVKEFKETMESK